MSTRILSQRIEKTCEGCKAVKVYELVDTPPEQLLELSEWRTVVRELWVGEGWQKITFSVCSSACLAPADAKIQEAITTPDIEQPENIDLESLRAKPNFKN